MRCEKCGKLCPQLATGRARATKGNKRQAVYEGIYKTDVTFIGSPLCMSCRHGGTKRGSIKPDTLSALKAMLWDMNKRKEAV